MWFCEPEMRAAIPSPRAPGEGGFAQPWKWLQDFLKVLQGAAPPSSSRADFPHPSLPFIPKRMRGGRAPWRELCQTRLAGGISHLFLSRQHLGNGEENLEWEKAQGGFALTCNFLMMFFGLWMSGRVLPEDFHDLIYRSQIYTWGRKSGNYGIQQ